MNNFESFNEFKLHFSSVVGKYKHMNYSISVEKRIGGLRLSLTSPKFSLIPVIRLTFDGETCYVADNESIEVKLAFFERMYQSELTRKVALLEKKEEQRVQQQKHAMEEAEKQGILAEKKRRVEEHRAYSAEEVDKKRRQGIYIQLSYIVKHCKSQLAPIEEQTLGVWSVIDNDCAEELTLSWRMDESSTNDKYMFIHEEDSYEGKCVLDDGYFTDIEDLVSFCKPHLIDKGMTKGSLESRGGHQEDYCENKVDYQEHREEHHEHEEKHHEYGDFNDDSGETYEDRYSYN